MIDVYLVSKRGAEFYALWRTRYPHAWELGGDPLFRDFAGVARAIQAGNLAALAAAGAKEVPVADVIGCVVNGGIGANGKPLVAAVAAWVEELLADARLPYPDYSAPRGVGDDLDYYNRSQAVVDAYKRRKELRLRDAEAARKTTYVLYEDNGGRLWTVPSLAVHPRQDRATESTTLADPDWGLPTWQGVCAECAAGQFEDDWGASVPAHTALPGSRCVAIWRPDGSWYYGDPGPNARVALGLDYDPLPDDGWADAVDGLQPSLAAWLAAGGAAE
jgi:hypothetical protein